MSNYYVAIFSLHQLKHYLWFSFNYRYIESTRIHGSFGVIMLALAEECWGPLALLRVIWHFYWGPLALISGKITPNIPCLDSLWRALSFRHPTWYNWPIFGQNNWNCVKSVWRVCKSVKKICESVWKSKILNALAKTFT